MPVKDPGEGAGAAGVGAGAGAASSAAGVDRQGDALAAAAVLAEPLRRRIYLHVAAGAEPAGRDGTASAMGIPRSVAAFHLDRLAEAGLLTVEFRRPPGRSGPGAGRPAKLYRRADTETTFSVPERHYDLAASLLSEALSAAGDDGAPVNDALRRVARLHGRAVGASAVGVAAEAGPPGAAQLAAVLERQGYEPKVDGDVVTFENCPFHRLAVEHPELVCGMNLEIAAGILEGAGLPPGRARLDPAPGRCCATITAG